MIVMMIKSRRRNMMMQIMIEAMTLMMLSLSGLPHLVTSGQHSYDDDECDGCDNELDVFFI